MQYILAYHDHLSIALMMAGGLCAVMLRTMPASGKRGRTKLLAFLLIALGLVVLAIGDLHDEQSRAITPLDVSGALINLHTVTSGYRSSPTQHYNVVESDGEMTPDLHDGEGLFFMAAQEGEEVQLTYTRESGYVTKLKILSGPHEGFQFIEPDVRNATPFYFFLIIAAVVGAVGIFKWIVDRTADPATGG